LRRWILLPPIFKLPARPDYRNPEVLLGMCRYCCIGKIREWMDFAQMQSPISGRRRELNVRTLFKRTGCQILKGLLDYIKPGSYCSPKMPNAFQSGRIYGERRRMPRCYHFPAYAPDVPRLMLNKGGRPDWRSIKPGSHLPTSRNGHGSLSFAVHDELSLELVYVTEGNANLFTKIIAMIQMGLPAGEGISARLSELMQRDPAKFILHTHSSLRFPELL